MGLLIAALILTIIAAVVCALIGWGAGDLFGALAGFVMGGFIAAFVFVLPATYYAQAHYNDRHVICTVDEKDRTSGENSQMRIYTKECGVFVNQDSWLRGKTTSADLYASINVGEKYDFHVVGWRLGLTSDFPNILDAKKVDQ